MRDLYNCRKVKDIVEEKKDIEGKMIKNPPNTLNMLNGIRGEDQNFRHAISSFTNNLRLLAQKEKYIADADVAKEGYFQSCVQ